MPLSTTSATNVVFFQTSSKEIQLFYWTDRIFSTKIESILEVQKFYLILIIFRETSKKFISPINTYHSCCTTAISESFVTISHNENFFLTYIYITLIDIFIHAL